MRRALLLVAVALSTGAFAQSKNGNDLAEFRAVYAKAKGNLAARPKDPKAKKAFVVAGDRLAMFTMNADSLSPREKYSGALRIYREVLKVDPSNREAKNNSGMIVAIYKQMGRPIPK